MNASSSRNFYAVTSLRDTYGRPYRVTVTTRDPKFPGMINTMGRISLHRIHGPRSVAK